MPGCTHNSFHSCQGRYSTDTQTLRYVVTCDACGTEVREVSAQQYAPAFDPRGNDAYLTG